MRVLINKPKSAKDIYNTGIVEIQNNLLEPLTSKYILFENLVATGFSDRSVRVQQDLPAAGPAVRHERHRVPGALQQWAHHGH